MTGRAPHASFRPGFTARAEYSLVYTDIDDGLNRIPAAYIDPREVEKMHREYDSTQRQPNIFRLNGRIDAGPPAITAIDVVQAGP